MITRNINRKGLSFHKYLIPARMEAQTFSFSDEPASAWRLPPRMIHRVTAETAKLAASSPNARPIPSSDLEKRPIRIPAIVGPIKPTSWVTPIMTELPACRSCSFTSIGTILFSAGMANPATRPNPRPKAYNIHIWTVPVKITTAINAVNTKRIASEISMITRGEMRSVIAPPKSMKMARGMPSSARTIPSASGSPVSLSTSQGVAINANWSPSMEVVAPENKSRKSRNENTAAMGFFLGGFSLI